MWQNSDSMTMLLRRSPYAHDCNHAATASYMYMIILGFATNSVAKHASLQPEVAILIPKLSPTLLFDSGDSAPRNGLVCSLQ